MADDQPPGSAASEKPDSPRLLPPVYFLGTLAVMLELAYFLPLTIVVTPPATYAGWALIATGFVIVITVWWRFEQAETTIKPYEVSTRLLTEGPFRFSRNPIYSAMVLGLLGAGVVLGAASAFLVIPVFIWLIRRKFIAVEEAMLEDAFGDDYRAYKSRVRRWL
ncbi:MAG: isoprenylcysteine carboxylmethyltransferase family protein [Rhodospirillaceae bacterium]